jgi:hypothetical protein
MGPNRVENGYCALWQNFVSNPKLLCCCIIEAHFNVLIPKCLILMPKRGICPLAQPSWLASAQHGLGSPCSTFPYRVADVLVQTYSSLAVFDQVDRVGLMKRLSPIHGVLMGESPVNRKTSYNHPPNMQPKNGDTIGIYSCY